MTITSSKRRWWATWKSIDRTAEFAHCISLRTVQIMEAPAARCIHSEWQSARRANEIERERSMKPSLFIGFLLLDAGIGWAMQLESQSVRPADQDALRAEMESLRPDHIAWREIKWRSCLLDGLAQSREQEKPIILWVFIDRPADDARC